MNDILERLMEHFEKGEDGEWYVLVYDAELGGQYKMVINMKDILDEIEIEVQSCGQE